MYDADVAETFGVGGRPKQVRVTLEAARLAASGVTPGEVAQALRGANALIGVFLGWREAAVVLVAVPVTLGLTPFACYALGYTLNRITLFALIFSIGIW